MQANFLRDLFGRAEGQWCYLWELSSKQSRWLECDAIPDPLGEEGRADIYVGVAVTSTRGGPRERATSAAVSGIVALWADVDYQATGEDGAPVHKKTKLPRDEEQARDIVAAFPLTPTYLIHSGHGYQCWWLFEEPWLFDGPEERAEAATLARRWLKTLQATAAEFGATLDSVFDLARVLRLPGTVNAKGAPVPVAIREETGVRYNPSDFEAYLVDDTPEATVADVAISEIDPTLRPNFARFTALYTNDPAFRALWEHKKKPLNDDSPSGYDLALANIAVRTGWSDQDVLAMLIAHRDSIGSVPKHKKYYESTIGKARGRYQAEATARRLEDDDGEAPTPSGEDIWKTVSENLGVPVTGLIEYLGAQRTYRLLTREGDVYLGGAQTLVNQTAFRTKVLEVVGALPTPMKGTAWTTMVNLMMRARETQDLGEDATETGRIRAWLHDYLTTRTAVVDSIGDAAALRAPLIYNGAVYVFSRHFQNWLRDDVGERIQMHDVLSMMRRLGVIPETLSYTHDGTGRRTSTELRRLPHGDFPAEEYMPRD